MRISIHASREGSDSCNQKRSGDPNHRQASGGFIGAKRFLYSQCSRRAYRNQGQKRPLGCRRKEAEAAKGSAPFLKTYQESQHSQTLHAIFPGLRRFHHYQESQHSQTGYLRPRFADGFYHYQESQHSQTAIPVVAYLRLFYHYQESQHSQTTNGL